MSNVVAIIQARLLSTRLSNKVMADIAGKPLLWHVIRRAKAIPNVDKVIVATTTKTHDKPIVSLARSADAETFTGSESDVLDRIYKAAKTYRADIIIRLTADCPLLDPQVSNLVLERFQVGDVDYASNIHPPTFPDGLDTEIVSFEALEKAWVEAKLGSEREHVTSHFWENPDKFRLGTVINCCDLSDSRWTVDEPQDLDFIRKIYGYLDGDNYSFQEVLNIIELHPDLANFKVQFARNEGYEMSRKQDVSD